jgi:hypothetical protein
VKPQLWPDHADFRWEEGDRSTLIVLLTSAVLLLVFFYWGRPAFYFTSGLSGYVADLAYGPLDEFPGVGAYLWWGVTSMVFRVGLPLLVIVWLLGKSPRDFGFRLQGIGAHLPVYGLMYFAMLPVLIWVSSFDSFLNYYPFYSRAVEGGAGFWLYELGYGLQFVGVEAFFRGFMTFGLLPRFGALSVVVMTVPYTMIHFAKPMPEAFAAIVAGLILGTMAVRSRSFVPGIFLHVAVAITMDLLVLARLGAIGNLF